MLEGLPNHTGPWASLVGESAVGSCCDLKAEMGSRPLLKNIATARSVRDYVTRILEEGSWKTPKSTSTT